ncbi:MAG: hypothetical protein ACREYB_12955 [Casimicrobiaceae bacterium]
MRKNHWIGWALAFTLAGCASGGPERIFTRDSPREKGYMLSPFVAPPNPTAPNIFIAAAKIVVDQEPVRPPGNHEGDPIAIYWALQEGGNYTFPEHGIEINGHSNFCSPVSAYVFRCSYSRPAPDTIYKYVIRVRDKSTSPPTKLKDLDPTIMN